MASVAPFQTVLLELALEHEVSAAWYERRLSQPGSYNDDGAERAMVAQKVALHRQVSEACRDSAHRWR